MWIFGYGSLIWRPSFAFVERRPAHVVGWERRFWQGSPDHRGTPEFPGRVVTVIAAPGAWCLGMAYLVEAHEHDAIMAHLDHREQGGYERHTVSLHPSPSAAPFASGVMYVAGPHNPHYLGPASLAEIARQVRASHGPSGANVEYVRHLARALREMGADDPHVSDLDAAIAAAEAP